MILLEAALALHLMATAQGSQAGRTDHAGYCVFRGASEANGSLRIYERETQVGTIAMREFRDDRGVVFLSAFYCLSLAAPAREHWPLRSAEIQEEDLVLQDVRFVSHDNQDRLVRQETFSSNGGLVRTEDVEYDSEGKKKKSSVMWTGFRGDRYYETTFTDRGQTTRVFDQDHRLITITGEVPPGEAPGGGWGPEKQGVAVNLIATPNPGRPVRVRLTLTRLDTHDRKARTYLAVFPYLELRGADNSVIPPTTHYADRVRRYRETLKGTPKPCERRSG